MASDVRVGLAGATGALGGEILRVLDRAPWRPEHVVALASPRTTVSHVEYGDERLPVDDLSDQAMDDLDVLILAVPSDVAREAGERAIAEGTPVVDCSGVFADDGDVPLVVPWINPEGLGDLARPVVSLPRPATTLLASALGPLRRAGVEGPVDATVLVPASIRGREGVEELSRQVVALFNSSTPPRRVFPEGLAFDLLPQLGPADDDGRTADERRVGAELERLLGASGPYDVQMVGVPVFSGFSAHVVLRSQRRAPPELVTQILADGGVRLSDDPAPRYVPRPRRVEGKPFAHAGRIRQGAGGELHLWLSMDNLATSAAVAVSLAGVFVRGLRGA